MGTKIDRREKSGFAKKQTREEILSEFKKDCIAIFLSSEANGTAGLRKTKTQEIQGLLTYGSNPALPTKKS